MKKFKYSMLSLPRTGSNWVRYWFEYFSSENTSERNVLVETNHWGEKRTEKTNATLYKRHVLSKEDLVNREIQKLVLVLRDYRECFVRHCRGRTFEKKIGRMTDFTDNLYSYEDFPGEKMIMYYYLLLEENKIKEKLRMTYYLMKIFMLLKKLMKQHGL